MEEKTKSEDLYEELRKTLENESAAEKAVVADDQKSTPEKTDETKITEDGELTDEEISKLHPKAQKRIKELAEQVKTLAEKPAEKPAEKSPDESPKEDKPAPNFKNVQEFLNAVEDEPSRNLLEKFYGVIKAETSTILAPVERANAEAKFNEEFSKYEKIEGLADYKNDLQKTFLRNPNQSLKALISETVTDITLNKIKPTETSPSLPNRSGDIDLDKLSTDELREKLDSMRGN